MYAVTLTEFFRDSEPLLGSGIGSRWFQPGHDGWVGWNIPHLPARPEGGKESKVLGGHLEGFFVFLSPFWSLAGARSRILLEFAYFDRLWRWFGRGDLRGVVCYRRPEVETTDSRLPDNLAQKIREQNDQREGNQWWSEQLRLRFSAHLIRWRSIPEHRRSDSVSLQPQGNR